MLSFGKNGIVHEPAKNRLRWRFFHFNNKKFREL